MTVPFVIAIAVLLGLLLFLIREVRRPSGPAKWGRVRRWPLGTYSVPGNHDWWDGGPKIRTVLEQNGIKVLENEVLALTTRDTSLWLVGLADLWTRPQHVSRRSRKYRKDKRSSR